MKIGTIIRMAVLVIALINQVLVTLGYQALPWSGDEAGQAISTIITIITAATAWWKNNSVSEHAIAADSVMEAIKEGVITVQDIANLIEPDDITEQENQHFTGNFDEDGNFTGEGIAEEVE